MAFLTKLEELALLAVLELKEEAYGISVLKRVSEITGKRMSIGSVYFPLDRMVEKGYLTAFKGEPTPKRGGIRKKHYRMTDKGLQVLEEMRKINDLAWQSYNGILSRE